MTLFQSTFIRHKDGLPKYVCPSAGGAVRLYDNTKYIFVSPGPIWRMHKSAIVLRNDLNFVHLFVRFRMSAPHAMLRRLAIVQRYVASCPALSSKYTVFLMRAAYPHHRVSTLQVAGKRSIAFFIRRFGVFRFSEKHCVTDPWPCTRTL